MREKRNLTITEAAELTGLSRKAMARRVERGSIRSVLRSGRRLIPRSELIRVGLLPAGGDGGEASLAEAGVEARMAASLGTDDGQSFLPVLIRELLEIVQRQAGEIAQYKALTVEAESLRMQREVSELRVRLSALEGGESQRALGRGSSNDAEPSPQMPFEQATQSGDRLWLPQSARATRTGSFPDSLAHNLTTAGRTGPEQGLRRTRLVSLFFEILFIALVALLVWLVGLDRALAAAAVGVAWAVAATFEVIRWRMSQN